MQADAGKARTADAERERIVRAVAAGDHYAVLGLQDLRWAASDAELKKAYRRLVLVYHPDKLAEGSAATPEQEATFRGIQKAYETLSDPDLRRDYDSQDAPKDDAFPDVSTCATPEAFYKSASDVFRRQQRWSKVTEDIPQLGDDSAPIAQVKAFYKWWAHDFESWRTFKSEDDHDINAAENRDERRWMEKQNEKFQREAKRDEKARMTAFVLACQKNDPRLKRAKAAKEAHAEERRRRAEEEDRAARERAEQAAREREAAQQAEREAAKEAREKEKKRAKEARKQLRAGQWANVETVIGVLSSSELVRLAADLQAAGDRDQAAALYQAVVDRIEAEARPASKQQPGAAKTMVLTTGAWSVEELRHLATATNKYPGGFVNRWDAIMAHLQHFGIHRSMDDVQKTAAAMKRGALASDLVDEDKEKKVVQQTLASNPVDKTVTADVVNTGMVWTPQQMKQLQDALAAVPKETDKRWEVVAARVVGKTATECHDRYAELLEVARKADEWTPEQQKQLEHGLKTVPAKDEQRWDKIAAGVPGKSRKEVIARYKWLVEKMKQQSKK